MQGIGNQDITAAQAAQSNMVAAEKSEIANNVARNSQTISRADLDRFSIPDEATRLQLAQIVARSSPSSSSSSSSSPSSSSSTESKANAVAKQIQVEKKDAK